MVGGTALPFDLLMGVGLGAVVMPAVGSLQARCSSSAGLGGSLPPVATRWLVARHGWLPGCTCEHHEAFANGSGHYYFYYSFLQF